MRKRAQLHSNFGDAHAVSHAAVWWLQGIIKHRNSSYVQTAVSNKQNMFDVSEEL